MNNHKNEQTETLSTKNLVKEYHTIPYTETYNSV